MPRSSSVDIAQFRRKVLDPTIARMPELQRYHYFQRHLTDAGKKHFICNLARDDLVSLDDLSINYLPKPEACLVEAERLLNSFFRNVSRFSNPKRATRYLKVWRRFKKRLQKWKNKRIEKDWNHLMDVDEMANTTLTTPSLRENIVVTGSSVTICTSSVVSSYLAYPSTYDAAIYEQQQQLLLEKKAMLDYEMSKEVPEESDCDKCSSFLASEELPPIQKKLPLCPIQSCSESGESLTLHHVDSVHKMSQDFVRKEKKLSEVAVHGSLVLGDGDGQRIIGVEIGEGQEIFLFLNREEAGICRMSAGSSTYKAARFKLTLTVKDGGRTRKAETTEGEILDLQALSSSSDAAGLQVELGEGGAKRVFFKAVFEEG